MRDLTLKTCAAPSWVLLLTALLFAPLALAQTRKQQDTVEDFPDVTYTAPAAVATAAPATSQPPANAQPAAGTPASTSNSVTASNIPATAALAAPQPAALPALSGTVSIQTSNCNQGPTREGFYFRMLSGLGFAGFRGNGPTGSASIKGLGSSSTIAIGGSLLRGLALAGTIQSTGVTADFKGGPFADATITAGSTHVAATKQASASFSELGVLLDWFPKPVWGLHTGASVGLGSITVVSQADGSTLQGSRFAGTVFIGYDWAISPSWALGLELMGSGATQAALKKNRMRDDSGYALRPITFGINASILYF